MIKRGAPQGDLKYIYLVTYKLVWGGKGSFDDAQDWVDRNGDTGYGFLATVIPIEEFTPDEFEDALLSYVLRNDVPSNILVVPQMVQRLKYVPPDDNGNYTEIPLSVLDRSKK